MLLVFLKLKNNLIDAQFRMIPYGKKIFVNIGTNILLTIEYRKSNIFLRKEILYIILKIFFIRYYLLLLLSFIAMTGTRKGP